MNSLPPAAGGATWLFVTFPTCIGSGKRQRRGGYERSYTSTTFEAFTLAGVRLTQFSDVATASVVVTASRQDGAVLFASMYHRLVQLVSLNTVEFSASLACRV